MDHFLQLENRVIGEILRMRRVRNAEGQAVLNIEGQDFFELWKAADPDIPILKQAKVEYAKLQ